MTHPIQGKDSPKKAINPKRKALILLSKQMRFLRDSSDEFEGFTINEMLSEFYSNGKELEFHTFKNWKEKGFKVRKGETAFLFWGKKRKVEQDNNPDPEATAYKFFPICYLFSQEQVEPIEIPA